MIAKTSGLAAHGHPDFVVDFGDAPEPLTKPVLDYLSQAVGAGTRFRPGEIIQYGGTLLQIDDAPGGHLTLSEPVPGSMPVAWRPTVEASVVTVARQRYVVDSLGIDDLDFVNPRAPGFVCNRARPDRVVVFSRFEPLDNGASWAAFCDEDHNHDDMNEIAMQSLYEIATRLSLFAMMWALPVKCVVICRPGEALEVELDGTRQAFEPGSFLAEFRVPS